jgi:thioredoxin reductase (NADPH)
MSAPRNYDVVCIGAGPGGLASALWCADLGLSIAIIDSAREPGGQLNIIHNRIENYPGFDAANGRELLDRLLSNPRIAMAIGEARVGRRLRRAALQPLSVELEDGETIFAGALVIATGVRRRELNVPGEKEFAGKGILASGAASREAVRGRGVVVVGGGDAAVENALILADTASRVTLVHRREKFTARADFVERARGHPNIEFKMSCSVVEFIGTQSLEGVRIGSIDGDAELISADFGVIRIGWTPNSELLDGIVDRDEAGFVITDAECRTSVPNIYAIGDVRRPLTPTISGAVGDAATVAKIISQA